MRMSKWYVGNTGRFTIKFVDAAGQPSTASAATITISRIDGLPIVQETSIVDNTTATGTYHYDWTPEDSGIYIAKLAGTVSDGQQVVPISVRVRALTDVTSDR